MKKLLITLLVTILTGSLYFSKLILIQSGTIPDELMGFDVDQDENLWIGRRGMITVYRDGNILRTVRPPTSRDYSFVLQNNKLIINSSTTYNVVEEYDLFGEFIGKSSIKSYELRDLIKSRRQIERNGNIYTLKYYGGFKPYEVFCNGNMIFRMSKADYFFNGFPNTLITILNSLFVLIMVVLIINDENCIAFFKRIWS